MSVVEIDLVLDTIVAEDEAKTACVTCKQIQAQPQVREFIVRGLSRGLSRTQVIRAIKAGVNVDVSEDSLRNHVRNGHV